MIPIFRLLPNKCTWHSLKSTTHDPSPSKRMTGADMLVHCIIETCRRIFRVSLDALHLGMRSRFCRSATTRVFRAKTRLISRSHKSFIAPLRLPFRPRQMKKGNEQQRADHPARRGLRRTRVPGHPVSIAVCGRRSMGVFGDMAMNGSVERSQRCPGAGCMGPHTH